MDDDSRFPSLPGELVANGDAAPGQAPAATAALHSPIARGLAGVACGFVAGLLITNSFWYGLSSIFTDDPTSNSWGLLMWGEHWAIRTVASLVATACASIIAAMVARERGTAIAVIAAVPTFLSWLTVEVVGWFGRIEIGAEPIEFDVSLGYKLGACPSNRTGL
jgi:hypothetical protein